MKDREPSNLFGCIEADLIGPTEAERRVLDLRAHNFTYKQIEETIGVKPKAAQYRVNAYHRRAGISMPPGRPSGKMNAGLLGGRDRLI